jgi:hypothetical protein
MSPVLIWRSDIGKDACVTVLSVIRFFFLKITIRVSVRDRRFLAADDPMTKPSKKSRLPEARVEPPRPSDSPRQRLATVGEFDARRRTVAKFSASQSIEIARNRETISKNLTRTPSASGRRARWASVSRHRSSFTGG